MNENAKPSLTKAEIIKKIKDTKDIKRESVHVDLWDVDVWVTTLSAEERDALDATLVREGDLESDATELIVRNMKNMRAKLVVLTAEFEDGDKMFSMDDVTWLTKKASAAVSQISDVAQRLSGMTKESVKTIRKN